MIGPVLPSTGVLCPLGVDAVRLRGGFWGERQEGSAKASIPHTHHWLEETGWLGNYLVAELARCQDRATAAGFNTGYLSAYPESFIDRVEARQSVWAPYWTKLRNDRLTLTQRQNMLDTEFGGMNETLTDLYQLTADPNHLLAAQYFDRAEIFDPLASNVDNLDDYHANTQIPKSLGAIREYHATGTTRYRDLAVNFWDIVTSRHSYAIGDNANGEYFKAPNRIASELSDTTAERRNTYNMLKLSRQLFFTNPARADYMDYYEKARSITTSSARRTPARRMASTATTCRCGRAVSRRTATTTTLPPLPPRAHRGRGRRPARHRAVTHRPRLAGPTCARLVGPPAGHHPLPERHPREAKTCSSSTASSTRRRRLSGSD